MTKIDYAALLNLPVLNLDLLRNVVQWAVYDAQDIENGEFADWGKWDQGHWATESRNGVCNTAFCIAGQTVAQSGFILDLEVVSENEGRQFLQADYCVPGYVAGMENGKVKRVPVPGAQRKPISQVALEMLGLNATEQALFGGSNSIQTVVAIATIAAKCRGLDIGEFEGVTIDISNPNYYLSYGSVWDENTGSWANLNDYFVDLVRNNGVSSPEFVLDNTAWFVNQDGEVYEYDEDSHSTDHPDSYPRAFKGENAANLAAQRLIDARNVLNNA